MTTTDPFAEAARAEADRQYWANPNAGTTLPGHRGPFAAGAEWARTHLAAQEPTEEQVEAAANAILAHEGETEETAHGDLIDAAWDHARAALSAARAARRDEEKR